MVVGLFFGTVGLLLASIVAFVALVGRRWWSREPTVRGQSFSRRATDVVHVKTIPGLHAVFISQAPLVARLHALAFNEGNVERASLVCPAANRLLGSQGRDAQRFRAVVAYALRANSIDRLGKIIWAACDEMASEIEAQSGAVPDLHAFARVHATRLLARLTYGSAAPRALCEDDVAEPTSWEGAVHQYLPWLSRCTAPRRAKVRRLAAQQRAQILESIRKGRKTFAESLFAEMERFNAEQRNNDRLTDEELISNAVGLSAGGIDSLASGITSILFFLACDAKVALKVAKQANTNAEHARAEPLTAFLALLSDARAVVEEAIRVHPPFAYFMPLRARKDFTLNDYSFRAGNWFVVDVALMHKQFKPLEFELSEQPGHSVAFGFGERSCVGRELAMTIMTVVAAEMARRFPGIRLKNVSDRAVRFEPAGRVTMPSKPIAVQFTEESFTGESK